MSEILAVVREEEEVDSAISNIDKILILPNSVKGISDSLVPYLLNNRSSNTYYKDISKLSEEDIILMSIFAKNINDIVTKYILNLSRVVNIVNYSIDIKNSYASLNAIINKYFSINDKEFLQKLIAFDDTDKIADYIKEASITQGSVFKKLYNTTYDNTMVGIASDIVSDIISATNMLFGGKISNYEYSNVVANNVAIVEYTYNSENNSYIAYIDSSLLYYIMIKKSNKANSGVRPQDIIKLLLKAVMNNLIGMVVNNTLIGNYDNVLEFDTLSRSREAKEVMAPILASVNLSVDDRITTSK